jgi:hypothetical protein
MEENRRASSFQFFRFVDGIEEKLRALVLSFCCVKLDGIEEKLWASILSFAFAFAFAFAEWIGIEKELRASILSFSRMD